MKVRELIEILKAYPDQEARVVSINPSEIDGEPVVAEIEAVRPTELFASLGGLDVLGFKGDTKITAAEIL